MLSNFGETNVASYLKTMAREHCEQLKSQGDLDDMKRARIEGKILAYNEMLTRFEMGAEQCEEVAERVVNNQEEVLHVDRD
ncbi:hypothetical protein GJU40_04955 [Bacillus lacus]|uniref:Uncharacterized protein n=1 Tax=Metabacillus lacus TaxID=1983721 RepID=A0A7X2IXA5_9BACI|nr:hypothetical protein [Metabacillus lacus]MRX71523.1 hypothetical protein [Metabacillus lacus]